jgi:hypothetical protein
MTSGRRTSAPRRPRSAPPRGLGAQIVGMGELFTAPYFALGPIRCGWAWPRTRSSVRRSRLFARTAREVRAHPRGPDLRTRPAQRPSLQHRGDDRRRRRDPGPLPQDSHPGGHERAGRRSPRPSTTTGVTAISEPGPRNARATASSRCSRRAWCDSASRSATTGTSKASSPRWPKRRRTRAVPRRHLRREVATHVGSRVPRRRRSAQPLHRRLEPRASSCRGPRSTSAPATSPAPPASCPPFPRRPSSSSPTSTSPPSPAPTPRAGTWPAIAARRSTSRSRQPWPRRGW